MIPDLSISIRKAFDSLPDTQLDGEFSIPSDQTRKIVEGLIHDAFIGFIGKTGEKIDIPSVEPVSDGGIDLHWHYDGIELLVNVPINHSSGISFYGFNQDKTEFIKGNMQINSSPTFLMMWLYIR